MKMILPENCKVKEIIFLCYLFATTNSRSIECNNSEKTKCCPTFEWHEENSTCIPCRVGYFGHACQEQCPDSHFGENCALKCNCTGKACHHIYGCRPLQDTQNDSSLWSVVSPKRITSRIPRGPQMGERSTSLVVTKSHILKDENGSPQYQKGGKNCFVKKKHRDFPTAAVSVMIACFTTISGLFLILYLGLHYCVKKENPFRAVF